MALEIQDEVNSLFRENDTIHAEDVRQFGYDNPESAIGKRLKVGDDTTAAHEWRLQESRNIIRLYVRYDKDTKYRGTVSLTMDRHVHNGYRRVEHVITNRELRLRWFEDLILAYERVGGKIKEAYDIAGDYAGVIADTVQAVAAMRQRLEEDAEQLGIQLRDKERNMRRDRGFGQREGDGDSPTPPPAE